MLLFQCQLGCSRSDPLDTTIVAIAIWLLFLLLQTPIFMAVLLMPKKSVVSILHTSSQAIGIRSDVRERERRLSELFCVEGTPMHTHLTHAYAIQDLLPPTPRAAGVSSQVGVAWRGGLRTGEHPALSPIIRPSPPFTFPADGCTAASFSDSLGPGPLSHLMC